VIRRVQHGSKKKEIFSVRQKKRQPIFRDEKRTGDIVSLFENTGCRVPAKAFFDRKNSSKIFEFRY